MKPTQAVDTLVAWLGQKGLKVTKQRRIITEAFFDPSFRDGHPTVEELYLRVRHEDPSIGHATVYRTLRLLVESGLASPSRLGDDQVRYEPDIPGEHHDHLVCTECGAIVEFEDARIEALQEEAARRLGFELKNHRMVLYGQPTSCPPATCRRGEA